MRPLDRIRRKSFSWPTAVPEDFGGGRMFMPSSLSDEASHSYESYVEKMYKANGIVFACITARQMPFSEIRFQMQEIVDGRPGRLRNDQSLNLLDRP